MMNTLFTNHKDEASVTAEFQQFNNNAASQTITIEYATLWYLINAQTSETLLVCLETTRKIEHIIRRAHTCT